MKNVFKILLLTILGFFSVTNLSFSLITIKESGVELGGFGFWAILITDIVVSVGLLFMVILLLEEQSKNKN